MSFLLNNQQKRFVAHNDGHALVLAGAGSGKTACCVARIARRMDEGVPPSSIMMLTFGNRAAQEIRERLGGMLGKDVAMPAISTFHGFGYRFLRRYAHLCGLRPGLTILDDNDRDRWVASTDLKKDEKKDLSEVLDAYDLVRARGVGWFDGRDKVHGVMPVCAIPSDKGVEWIARYEEYKKTSNLIDFSDLIMLPIKVLESNPGITEQYRLRLLDLTVDEAQDNNNAQYRLIRLLADKTIVMVGDDDQSIYGFRGAAPECMRQFVDDFDPEIYYLETNYRSVPEIVSGALDLIRLNTDRLEKNPVSARESSDKVAPVTGVSFWRFNDEVSWVVGDIRQKLESGVSANDIAVLYRVNALSQQVERYLAAESIPYAMQKGVSLFDRIEMRILICFSRLIVNPYDVSAFEYIAKIIPGVGNKAVAGAREHVAQGGSVWDYKRYSKKSQTYIDMLKEELQLLKSAGPVYLTHWLIESEMVMDYLDKMSSFGDKDKKEDIKNRRMEMLSEMQDIINKGVEKMPVEGAWEWVVQMATDISEAKTGDERVTLGTFHGAKGLEWRYVYIIGMMQGVSPILKEDTSIDEERRLAYVAFTRAKDALYVSRSEEIYLHGRTMKMEPSQFISEAGVPNHSC